MKTHYSISIPKPCHENWNTMSPKDKGRFCDSCTKTVIDFSKMSPSKVQDFIHKNKHNRICGHFKQGQLDSINLQIPSHLIKQQRDTHKLFLLALLIVMGTSLFSCTNKQGNIQKIDSIEVVDSISKKAEPKEICTTNTKASKNTTTSKKAIPLPTVLDGLYITEPIGDIEVIEEDHVEIDSIKTIEIDELDGEVIVEVMGAIMADEALILGFINVETPPEFKNTPKNLSIQEKRVYFSKKMSAFIHTNFKYNSNVNLILTGKQRVNTQFTIDSLGFIKNIRTRAPHISFEKEVKRVLELLPQFIPAKQKGEAASIIYNLPIIIQVED